MQPGFCREGQKRSWDQGNAPRSGAGGWHVRAGGPIREFAQENKALKSENTILWQKFTETAET
jgi:hypothetical protein